MTIWSGVCTWDNSYTPLPISLHPPPTSFLYVPFPFSTGFDQLPNRWNWSASSLAPPAALFYPWIPALRVLWPLRKPGPADMQNPGVNVCGATAASEQQWTGANENLP